MNFQVEKLGTIRSMLAGDATTPEKPKRKKEGKQAAPSAASSHGIVSALLSLHSHQLRNRNLLRRLIPCWHLPGKHLRKAILKADVAAKKPAAKGFEKPAAAGTGSKKANGISDSFKVEGPKLTLMHYKATMGGKQLLQVKSKKGPQESKKLAEHLTKKLEEGWDLGKAKAWKAQQLARD